jgi:hypothetical protein
MNRNEMEIAVRTNKKVARMRDLMNHIRNNFRDYLGQPDSPGQWDAEPEVKIDGKISRDFADWFLLMDEATRQADIDSSALRWDAEAMMKDEDEYMDSMASADEEQQGLDNFLKTLEKIQ